MGGGLAHPLVAGRATRRRATLHLPGRRGDRTDISTTGRPGEPTLQAPSSLTANTLYHGGENSATTRATPVQPGAVDAQLNALSPSAGCVGVASSVAEKNGLLN